MKLALKFVGCVAFASALVVGAASLPRQPRETYVTRGQVVCGQTRETLELCRLLVPAEAIYWVASVESGHASAGDVLHCTPFNETTYVPAKKKNFSALKLRCRDGAGTESVLAVRGYEYGPLEDVLKRSH